MTRFFTWRWKRSRLPKRCFFKFRRWTKSKKRILLQWITFLCQVPQVCSVSLWICECVSLLVCKIESMYVVGSKSFRSDQLFKVTNKTTFLFFNIVSLYFNTLFNWYINLTIDGAIYPSQHFPFGAAFACQAENFWTLLRIRCNKNRRIFVSKKGLNSCIRHVVALEHVLTHYTQSLRLVTVRKPLWIRPWRSIDQDLDTLPVAGYTNEDGAPIHWVWVCLTKSDCTPLPPRHLLLLHSVALQI